MSKKLHKGSCLCGSVKISTDKLSKEGICFCHCSQCRKNYGMYGAFVGTPKESINVVGDKNIQWYKSSPKVRRGFCRKCGSGIFWEYIGSKNIYTHAGLLDNFKTHKGFHIYTKDKGGYYALHDKLPKFKQIPK